MIAKIIPENLRQYKIRFTLIRKQVLAFASHPNMVSEVKNLLPDFKQTARRCFTLLNYFIWIVRFILSLNSKQFHQKLYLNGLY